ncbi:MAG TPA: Xaa-Pro peptidase family protein [Candidatus Binatia bacterium]
MNPEIVERQKGALAAAGLDALIALSPENVTYTTGIVVPSQSLMRWRHAAAVVTGDGLAALLAIDMEETTVKSHGVKNVRVYREFSDDPIDKLADLLIELGLERGRLGFELEYLPARDFSALQRRLPRAAIAAADGVFNKLRAVKSRAEIELLRELSKITDRAIGATLRGAHAGTTEMELAGALVAGVFAGGAENFKLMIIASGERSQYPNVGPTGRAIEKGDLIRMEIFGMKNGYHAGVCRTAVVGGPTAEQEKIWKNLIECKHLVMEMIKPGAACKEVYQRFLKHFGALGFDPISFVGHGIGLFLHEEPYLGRYGDEILQEGMVVAIEPLVYIPGRMGLQNKDMLVVTTNGCELLSDQTPTDDLLRTH